MLVTLKVVHQICAVHHHHLLHLHHHHHHNVNHKKTSVFLSALQTYFKLRVHFGFLFSLFVCCVLCNSTSNNICGCHHYVIIMSELFSSLCLANIFIHWKIPFLTVLAGRHNQQEALKLVSQKI